MIRRRHLDPHTVRGFRERRGWTVEEMADMVAALPVEVAAWEAGTVRVPDVQAQWIRTIALAAPVQPVQQLAEGNPAPAPRVRASEPEPGFKVGLFERIGDRLDRWPRIVLVPFLGLAGGAAVVGPALLMGPLFARLPDLPAIPPIPNLWWEACALVLGRLLAERFVSKPLRSRPYAAGLVTGVAGALAGLLTWRLTTPGAGLADPLALSVFAVVALVTGLATGWVREGAEDDAEPADAETAVAAPAPDPLLTEGASVAGLNRVIERRGEPVGTLDRNGA